MLLQQQLASGNHILGFGAEQADGLDIRNQAIDAERQHAGRRIGDRVQAARGFVDRDIGGLRRQQYRDQQLERCLVFQFGLGMWIGLPQPGENFAAFFAVHGLFAACLRRARSIAA